MGSEFLLDIRLSVDTEPIVALQLADVRLMNDARFPWAVLVPKRTGKVEIVDLDPPDRARLMEEIALVSRALKAVTDCHKLNVGALGNIVRQLHVHIIARFPHDPAWPGPVWGVGAAKPYKPDEKKKLIGLLQAALPA